FFIMKSPQTNNCLRTSGSNLVLGACDNKVAEGLFVLSPDSNNYYTIISKLKDSESDFNMCVDHDNGKNLSVVPCSALKQSQKFEVKDFIANARTRGGEEKSDISFFQFAVKDKY